MGFAEYFGLSFHNAHTYLGGLEVVSSLLACTVSLNLLSMVSFSFNLFGSSGVNSFEVLILALLRLRDFSLRLLIVESTLVVWWWLVMVAGWWTGCCCCSVRFTSRPCCCSWDWTCGCWVIDEEFIEEGNGLVWPEISMENVVRIIKHIILNDHKCWPFKF